MERVMDYHIFVVTAPGVEALTAGEMRALGLAGKRVGHPTVGGLEFLGPLRDLYRLNLHLRTANRVLVRLGEFYAAAFSELHKKAGRLPWNSTCGRDSP